MPIGRTESMTELQRRLRFAALLILVIFLVGVFGYKALDESGAPWSDAVWMTVNTLTTAGFREVVPITTLPAKIFASTLLLFGAGAVVYATSVITAFVVEGDLTQGFRRRRMRRAIQDMSDHYIVCGAGATGTAVLRELVKTEHEVVVVELDKDRVRRMEEDWPDVPVIRADFTDDQVLIQAGVQRASGIVICTTIDKDSLVTTITARQLHPGIRIIARAANERSAARLRQAGADGVVAPAIIGGMRMASELVRPSVVSFLDTMLRVTERSLRVEEVGVGTGSHFAGRTVAELDARKRAGCLLLAVKRHDSGEYVYNPADDLRLAPGMLLIVMGDAAGVRTLRSACDVGSRPPAAPTPQASMPALNGGPEGRGIAL